MKTKEVPFLKSLAVVKSFQKDPILCMNVLAAQSTDLVSLNLGFRRIHFVFHPDLAEKVLRSEASSYQKARLVFDQLFPLTGKRGLVQLENEDGKMHRKITAPAVGPSVLNLAAQKFSLNTLKECESLRLQISEKNEIDLEPVIAKIVLRNALFLLLGDCPEELSQPLIECFLKINEQCGARIKRMIPFAPFIRSKEVRQLDRVLRGLIAHQTDTGGVDLLSLLRRCPFANDTTQVRDHLATYLFAGFETTTTSILMTLHCLTKNPNVTVPLELAYKEALRLYPPSWTLAREAITPCALGNIKVKKRDLVLIGLPQIQRRGDFFENPNAFQPLRFEKALTHPFSYLPFGGGSRICIGMGAASFEAKIVLETLLSQFRFEGACEDEPEIEALITAHLKNGLKMKVMNHENRN